MKKLTCVMLLLLTILALVSCADSNSSMVISDLNNQINTLQADKDKAERNIKKLEREKRDFEKELDVEIDTMEKTSPLHWLEQTNWDKLIIKDDSNTVVVTDKALLHPIEITGRVKRGSGGPFWQEKYSFEFVKGNKKYKIKVIEDLGDDLNFEYKGTMYKSEFRLDSFYRAFLPGPNFVNTGSTLHKMFLSPLIKLTDKDGSFGLIDNFRIQGIVLSLYRSLDDQTIQILKNDVSDPGKLRASVIFYYYGEQIVLNVYRNHASLKEGTHLLNWYQIDNPNDIVGVVYAS